MDAPAPAPAIQAVVFDLGNVLLEIDFDRTLAAWARHSRLPLAELQATFRQDEPYLQHEVGALPEAGYFDHLRRTLQLDADDATLRAGWNALLVREIAPTLALVDALRAKVPCHVFSNTNATHIEAVHRGWPQLLPRFGHVFTSHRMGLRKPAPESFLHVTQTLGLAPSQVLFFDDLADNVQAARQCGLQATLVRNPGDVSRTLAACGF